MNKNKKTVYDRIKPYAIIFLIRKKTLSNFLLTILGLIIFCVLVAIILPGNLWFSEDNWFDNDTIRYFFSAVFQGFSALLAILFVALMYNLGEFDKQILEHEKMCRGISILKETPDSDVNVKPETLLEFKNDIIKSKNIMKTNIKIDFLSLTMIIIISVTALALFSWYIQNYRFWNIFFICFITFLSIYTLVGIGKTLHQTFFM